MAYESLLTTRRQVLHAAAGQALEALYADHLADAYDRLAYHYAPTEDAAKAVEYLIRVAEKAARGYAHAEAVTTFQEALIHAERLSADERDHRCLDVAIRQAESLHWSGRRQELVDLLLGQQERLERLRDPSLAGLYSCGLGRAYTFLGKRESAAQSLQRALEEGTRCGDVVIIGRALGLLTMEMFFAGRIQQSIMHGQQGVSLLEKTVEHFWLGEALYFLGLAYHYAGDLHGALEVATRAQAIGEAIGDRRLQVTASGVMGRCCAAQGEWEAGIAAC